MRILRTVLFILVMLPMISQAAQTVYSDRSAWESAVSNASVQREDFNSVVNDLTFTDSSTVIGSLELTSTGGAAGAMLIDALPGEFSSGNGIDGSSFLNAGGLGSTSVLTITFPQPVQAFGFDTMNYDQGGEQAEIFVNGESVGLTPFCTGGDCADPNQAYGFAGVVSSVGMTFVTIEIRGAAETTDVAAAFDNLDYVYGLPTSIPTLGTIGLALLTLMLLGVGLYKRQQRI